MRNLIDVLGSEKPTLVDFYADWCGPCKTQAVVLADLIADFKGKVKILKVDIDENPAAARHYDVRSIPTLILFQKGRIVWRHIGMVPYTELRQVLDYHSRHSTVAI